VDKYIADRIGSTTSKAYRLQEFLKDKSIAFFSSDLLRAIETAQIIGEILEIVPDSSPALRDINWGIAIDIPLQDAKKLELEKTEPLYDWIPFPEAESWRMLHERVTPFLDSMATIELDAFLIVSHANVIEECIFWWLQSPLESRRNISFEIATSSITYLHITDWEQRSIALLSGVDHLLPLSS
jgi:probable phosphoglycerate mutase